MSGWKLAVKELHALGGSSKLGRMYSANHDLWHAREFGMVRCDGRTTNAVWSLTPQGIAFVEGLIGDAAAVRDAFAYDWGLGKLMVDGKPVHQPARRMGLDSRRYTAAHMVWAWVYGRWPKAIKYLNGDRRDTTLWNLLEVL